MAVKVNTTEAEVKTSVSDLYKNLLAKRAEAKGKKKEVEETEEAAKADGEETVEDRPLTKKEKRARAMDSWKAVVEGLVEEDLDYVPPKRSKRRFKKWTIDTDLYGEGAAMPTKPKKKRKVNYNKEFEPELNMLKSIVADQNKFTSDLQKRYHISVGPNTKDAGPLNKTQVDLAAAIVSGRSTSLAVLREIGNLKKTKYNLYMDELKLNKDGKGSDDSQDLTRIGSNVAQQFYGAPNTLYPSESSQSSTIDTSSVISASEMAIINNFDPSTWGDESTEPDMYTKYENTPKKTVVEVNEGDGQYRFKTINTDTGNEILDYPNPTFKITTINKELNLAKDAFDKSYEIEYVA